MSVWQYQIVPAGTPRSGQISLREGSAGIRTWAFGGGIPTDNEMADAAIDRFLANGTTSGTITLAVSTDVSTASRAYDYAILPGASRLSGRIVSCRRSPVNVAHVLDVTTPNIRGETLVNV